MSWGQRDTWTYLTVLGGILVDLCSGITPDSAQYVIYSAVSVSYPVHSHFGPENIILE